MRRPCAHKLRFARRAAVRRTLKEEDTVQGAVLRKRTVRTRTVASTAGAILTVALIGCGPAAESAPTFHPSTPAEAAALTYFSGTVKPILREECYRCHGTLNHKGGFNLGTRAQLLQGGHHGGAVVPGHPEQGLLMVVLRHQGPADHPMPMPQKGDILPPDQLAAISKWIADGAVMDR